jgi:hypothetical protein
MSKNLTIPEHVHILNESIRLKNLIIESLPKQFEPFLNQKIVKVDGGLIEKFKKSITFPDFVPVSITGGIAKLHYCLIKTSYSSFYVEFSICFHGGSYDDNSYYCHYESDSIYLGTVNNQILQKIDKFELLPSIDAEKEIEKIKQFKELEQKTNDLKRSINVPESIYKYL